MLKFLTDADFNGRIYRAIRRLEPNIDIVRVQDIGLRTADDPTILEYAANEDRILLSHDRCTMIRHAWDRIDAGLEMPGLVIADADNNRIGQMRDDIITIALASYSNEWRNQIVILPL